MSRSSCPRAAVGVRRPWAPPLSSAHVVAVVALLACLLPAGTAAASRRTVTLSVSLSGDDGPADDASLAAAVSAALGIDLTAVTVTAVTHDMVKDSGARVDGAGTAATGPAVMSPVVPWSAHLAQPPLVVHGRPRTLPPSSAGAHTASIGNTDVIIYVRPGGTNGPDCGSTTTTACGTVAYAIVTVAAAVSPPSATVHVMVAAGAFGADSCGAVSSRPLSIEGAGAGDTVVDCEWRGRLVATTADVSVTGVTVLRGLATTTAAADGSAGDIGGGAIAVLLTDDGGAGVGSVALVDVEVRDGIVWLPSGSAIGPRGGGAVAVAVACASVCAVNVTVRGCTFHNNTVGCRDAACTVVGVSGGGAVLVAVNGTAVSGAVGVHDVIADGNSAGDAPCRVVLLCWHVRVSLVQSRGVPCCCVVLSCACTPHAVTQRECRWLVVWCDRHDRQRWSRLCLHQRSRHRHNGGYARRQHTDQ